MVRRTRLEPGPVRSVKVLLGLGLLQAGVLAQQRLVLSSIKHLLAGDRPPVHAVDALETRTP